MSDENPKMQSPTPQTAPPPIPPPQQQRSSGKQIFGVVLLVIGGLITAIGVAHLFMGMGGSEQVVGLVFGVILVIAGLALATARRKS